jgi:putative tricarboxylic transport membrane protein
MGERHAMARVKDQKDFWSGVLFVAFGCAGLWFGRNYAVGSLSRMGPGFFPMTMSVALVCIGGFLLARSLVVSGEAVERIALWPQLLILAGIVGFGLLIERVGLAVSVGAVAVISGIAAQGLRWFELTALALAMSALSVALFVYLLGQPIPVWVR